MCGQCNNLIAAPLAAIERTRPIVIKMNKTTWAVLAKVFLSAVVLALLFHNLEGASVRSIAARLDPVMAGCAIVPLLLIVLLQAERFRRATQLVGDLSIRGALQIVWIGQFFSQVLPGAVGGDAFRAWYLSRFGIKLKQSITVAFLDRAYGIVALLLLLVLGLPWLLLVVGDLALSAIAGLVVVGGFGAIAVGISLERLPARWFSHAYLASLLRFSIAVKRGLTTAGVSLPCIGLSFVIQVLGALSLWLIGQSLQVGAIFAALLVVSPLTNIAMMLPISIAGWGIREAVIVSCLNIMDVPASEALVLSVLSGLLNLVASLPGLVVWLLIKVRKPAPETV